ncbi:MAG: hypothetical protein GY769_04425 [bacterium]|nr:hypothetical protein [bacterium]
MAELTVVDLPEGYEDDIASTPVNPGFVAGTVAGDTFRCTGKEILLVWNQGGAPYTVTVTSQPLSVSGRTGDITAASIPAGVFRVFQIFPRDGWESGGLVSIAVSNALVFVAVLRAPIQAQG